jgi:hypothetical protein
MAVTVEMHNTGDPGVWAEIVGLKLLDDDCLNSVMTYLRYEVNSKIARAVQANLAAN